MSDNLSAFRKLLRNKRRTQPLVLAYYATEQDWLDIRGYCSDAYVFHATYDLWLADHNAACQLIRKSREDCQRTKLTVDSFREFCVTKGIPPDTNARTHYAVDMVTEHPERVELLPWKS